MDEISLHHARNAIGDIVNRARFGGTPTLITSQGKPAAVVVSVPWYEDAESKLNVAELPTKPQA
jgi:prevent-host-death family protein